MQDACKRADTATTIIATIAVRSAKCFTRTTSFHPYGKTARRHNESLCFTKKETEASWGNVVKITQLFSHEPGLESRQSDCKIYNRLVQRDLLAP